MNYDWSLLNVTPALLKTIKGRTAHDIAKKKGYTDVIDYLRLKLNNVTLGGVASNTSQKDIVKSVSLREKCLRFFFNCYVALLFLFFW